MSFDEKINGFIAAMRFHADACAVRTEEQCLHRQRRDPDHFQPELVVNSNSRVVIVQVRPFICVSYVVRADPRCIQGPGMKLKEIPQGEKGTHVTV